MAMTVKMTLVNIGRRMIVSMKRPVRKKLNTRMEAGKNKSMMRLPLMTRVLVRMMATMRTRMVQKNTSILIVVILWMKTSSVRASW